MKTFPAICVGVLFITGAIALKIGIGAWQPKERGNHDPRTDAGRKSAAAPSVAKHEADATDFDESGVKPLPGDSSGTIADGDPFSQHCASELAAIRRESNPEAREKLLADLAAWMEGRDAAGGLHFLSGQEPSELIEDLQERLLQQWAGKDAPAAATAAQKIGGQNASAALGTVLRTWAEERLSEAIAWVNQMSDGEEKQAALLELALTAARTEPQTAVALASDLPSSPERDEMILHTASQWAVTDPTGASAWAREIESSSLRDQVLMTIATVLGDSDPIAAATLALEALPLGKAQSDAVVGIVQRWAQNDPKAAAAWVGRFPEGALRNAAVENIAKLWADKDARPAGEWLNSLPPGESRNSGIRAYAEQIAPFSPQQAAVWAGTITDAKMRIAQLENIAKVWMESDSVAATAWISKMPFSQEFRSQIFRR